MNTQAFGFDEFEQKFQLDKGTIRKAQIILSNAKTRGVLRGRSGFVLSCASVFVACRLLGNPLTIKEISQITGVSPKRLFHGYKVLKKALKLPTLSIDPEYLVLKYSLIFNISRETINLAVSIIDDGKSSSMGRSPIVIAATAIYLASTKCNELITQKQIAAAMGIASKSIRNCSTDLQRLSIDIIRA